jgi:hypothetical protein
MLTEVVEDFLPNIGNCALQDYGRLNTAMIASKKRLKDKSTPTATTTTGTYELAYDSYSYHSVEIEAESLEQAIEIGKSMNDENIMESFCGEIESPEDGYYLAQINWTTEEGEINTMSFGP